MKRWSEIMRMNAGFVTTADTLQNQIKFIFSNKKKEKAKEELLKLLWAINTKHKTI